MSSTNKTTNYNLSQFIGSDKPAWLQDYNTDMTKIDTAIKSADDTAVGADGKADANATSIGTLENLTTTTKTSLVAAINEVDANADTAQSSAGSALSTANAAGSKADSALAGLNKFNLNNRSTLTPSTDRGSIAASSYVRFATDTTSSIFKCYGRVGVTFSGSSTGTVNVTLGTTSLRPSSAYTIEAGALMYRYFTTGYYDVTPLTLNVATNGVITVASFGRSDPNFTSALIWLPPCLYFNTDFGDEEQ